MSKKTKATNAELERRVAIITEMLLSGLSRYQICQNVRTNNKLAWNVSDCQIDRYIKKATADLHAQVEAGKPKLANHLINRYNYLYQKLVNVKDYKGAVTATDKLAELAGLKIQRNELSGTINLTGFKVIEPEDADGGDATI